MKNTVASRENFEPRSIKSEPTSLLGSCRLSLAVMIFFGNVNMYMMRVNLSVAIVCMVNHTDTSEYNHHIININSTLRENGTEIGGVVSCSSKSNILHTGKENGDYSWDKATQGRILASFYVGYIFTQVIGGFLSTRFGGKRVFGWSMLICAVLTILVPVAVRIHVYLLIGLRFLTGLCQGVMLPAQQSISGNWNPPMERSFLGSLGIAGAYIGHVVAFPLAALLCAHGFDGGWPSIFYVCGVLGILWFIAWMYLVSDSPNFHPRISNEEKAYIVGQLGEKSTGTTKVVPWLRILTSRPVWAVVVAHICLNWGEYTFATNMPTYLKEVLKFDIETNGFLSALPYIGISVIISVSGIVGDCIRRRNILNTGTVRKLFNTIGCLLPSVLVITAGFMDCDDSIYAVTLLTLGLSATGCQYGSGFMINPLDIAPNYAGIIVGISNTFATLPGFLSPIIVSELTQNKAREEWQTVFYITGAIYVTEAAVFVIFGSGDQQDWDPKDEGNAIDTSKSNEPD